jgi:DNA-directed RNA polymerase specialized sigma24 family protein
MTDPRSFDDFEKALRTQQNDAVYELFSRFTERLVRLARGQIALRLQSKEDPQDIVQSALRTFCLRYAEGQFTVGGWESLWALLAKITTRKCLARSRHYGAGKRDHKLEVSLDAPESIERELELWSTEPQPEDVIALAETVELLLRSLKKDRDRKIL